MVVAAVLGRVVFAARLEGGDRPGRQVSLGQFVVPVPGVQPGPARAGRQVVAVEGRDGKRQRGRADAAAGREVG